MKVFIKEIISEIISFLRMYEFFKKMINKKMSNFFKFKPASLI